MIREGRNYSSGFTLVEVLIAMAIFGIILAGVVKVYEVSNRSYMVQQDMAAMQQNVRVSKMFLERDVRMAGCGMGTTFGLSGNRVYALEFDDNNPDGDAGTDKITISYIDYEENGCDDLLPQLTLTSSMPATSTEAEITQDFSNPSYSIWDGEFTCGTTTYGGSPFKEFQAIVTSPDGSSSEVVWVTNIQNTGGTDKVQNGPYPVGCGSDCNKILNTYPAGSTLSFFDEDKLVQAEYDVVNTVLRRNGQALAEDIEDLQFSFGLDTDGDDEVDTWINDADLDDTEKDQVRVVTITVLGRTASEHRGFTGSRPAIEDHTAAASTDGYRRMKLQFTVMVRNLGL